MAIEVAPAPAGSLQPGPADAAPVVRDPGPAAGGTGSRRRRGGVALTAASRGLLVLLGSLLLWSVLPGVGGWQSAVVMSGSMEPRLSVGDVVVVRPAEAERLTPGQVLLVDDPDRAGRLLLHRLVAVDRDSGELTLRGDANARPDAGPVRPDAVHGIAALRVPWLGRPAVWLAEDRPGALLAAGAAALAALAGAAGFRAGPRGGPSARVARTGFLVAPLAGLLVSVLVVWQSSFAAFTATTSNGQNAFGAGTLAAPTSLAVLAQECVADASPVRRTGAGGFSFTSGNTSGSLTIAKPSGAVAGDVLVAGITWEGNHASASPTAPSGWTSIRRDGDSTIGQFVYYRVVTASEPSSSTWTGLGTNAAGAIAAFSGVDTTAPVNVHGGQVNTTNFQITAPSVTTTRANVLLVGVFGLVQQQTLQAPAGMSVIWNGTSSGTGADFTQVSTLGADEGRPTPGATGTRTATTPSGSRSIGQLIALQPPAKPHATSTWTASSSSYATGQVFRRSSGGSVQRQATLSASATTQTDGPLVSGTGYTVDVTATFANWRSPTTASSFTAMAC